jgi:hypothetical protein
MKDPIKIEITLERSEHNNKTYMRYGVSEFDGLTQALAVNIAKDFQNRIVEELVQDLYPAILKDLDLELMVKLVTLEAAKSVGREVVK